jgi:hypothetical protein
MLETALQAANVQPDVILELIPGSEPGYWKYPDEYNAIVQRAEAQGIPLRQRWNSETVPPTVTIAVKPPSRKHWLAIESAARGRARFASSLRMAGTP